MMSVPWLDLAPKLKRRLLIWNPLDHLRLLYWVFFFPQAIPWYIEAFTSGLPDLEGKDLRHRLMAIWNNPLRRLQVQSIVCAVIVSSVIAAVLRFTGMSVSWIGVVGSVAIGGLWSISRATDIKSIAENIALGMIVSIIGCVAFGVAFGSSGNILFVGIAFGVALGLMLGASYDISGGVQLRRVSTGVRCIVIGMVLFLGVMALNIVVAIVDIGLSNIAVEHVVNVIIGVILNSVLVGFITGIVSQLVILRFDAWLIGMVSILGSVRDRQTFAHATLLLLPGLRHSLHDWLIKDWETGLHNVDQLLRYTSQYVPVIGAVNDALDALPKESLLPALERLNEQPYGYTLLRFTSISMGRAIWVEVVRGFFIPDRLRQKLVTKLGTDPRLDTPVHAAASGFLYLHLEQPEKSAEAFEVVRSFPHWNEVVQLARAVAWARWVRTSDEVISLAEWPEFDKAEDGLPLVEMRPHPFAWQAFRRLKRTVSEIRTAWGSSSRVVQLQALYRGLDELAELLKSIEIASTEYSLTRGIAESWQDWLQRVKKEGFSAKVEEMSEKQVPEPVRNPYQVGGPVIGPGFVGREDIMDNLAKKWAASSAVPSVVLFGHRRMGKTSILRNLSNHVGASVHVAYRDLNSLGNAPGGIGQVLRTLADDIAQELRRAGFSVPEVNPAAFATDAYQAFEQYLSSVRDVLGRDRLIIALDEFEQLEEWMNAGRIPRDFLKVLRSHIQMDPRIAFAFAGLHNLEEMNEDYFNPFYASVQTVKASFFDQAAVYQALERSVTDLMYEQDALERVWELTAGQPYLVELIGYRLVERYNELVVRPGARPEPRFTVADVDAVIADPEFYSVGRQYFTGIWGQAEQGEPGQLDVLSTLAPHRGGLTLDALMAATKLNKEALSAALKVLNRHDVVVQDGACWRYTVELMRRWVMQEHGQSPDSE